MTVHRVSLLVVFWVALIFATVLAIWGAFSKASVDPYYVRIEQRPAGTYLGDRDLPATGDFDNDGSLDEAFFVKVGGPQNEVVSIVVSFGSRTKQDQVVDTFEATDALFHNIGLKVASAGEYIAACARGAGEPCDEGEEYLDLRHDGIYFFYYEASARLYYLPEDSVDKGFKVFYLSD